MMTTTKHATNHGFFGQVIAQNISSQAKKALVDVGGQGDCGFRAVAAGIVDNFLINPRLKGDLLGNLLPRHYNYFPQHRHNVSGLITPAERMEQLITQVRMPELIQTLAYTLRQIAVDELCAKPAHYRGAFANQHEQTAPEIMRKPSTWIDETAIAALSNALDLPIEVNMVSHGKELPVRLQYNISSKNQGVVMQLQDVHYMPRVTHSERFTTVKSQQASRIKAAEDVASTDPSLTEILTKIAEENKHLVHEFENTRNRLSAMVAAGELNKQDLLAIYIKGMATSDYLPGRVKYIGIEHGNQDFFAAIMKAQQGVAAVELSTASYDEQVINELVHGIARAVSIGHMNAADVFAEIDNKEHSRSSRVLG